MIYILMMVISIFFLYLAMKSKSKKTYYIFLVLSFLLPFLISAFRGIKVGTDTSETYVEIYNAVINKIPVRDFGFGFLTKISIILFRNFQGILIVTSFIFMFLSYYSIIKYSNRPVLSLILFFTTNVYFVSMNMIRQSIATAIFIYSIKYIKQRKLLPYLLCIFVAFSMHTMALLYLPMYFLYNIELNKKSISIYITLLIAFKFLLIDTLIKLVLKIPYFAKYFGWYFSSSKYNTGNFNFIGLSICICILLFLIIIYKSAKKDKNYQILLWNQIIAFSLLMLSSNLPLMQRTSWLFTFPIYIFLPDMFKYIKNSKNRLFTYFFINLGYISYMFITIFVLRYNEVFPYHIMGW